MQQFSSFHQWSPEGFLVPFLVSAFLLWPLCACTVLSYIHTLHFYLPLSSFSFSWLVRSLFNHINFLIHFLFVVPSCLCMVSLRKCHFSWILYLRAQFCQQCWGGSSWICSCFLRNSEELPVWPKRSRVVWSLRGAGDVWDVFRSVPW